MLLERKLKLCTNCILPRWSTKQQIVLLRWIGRRICSGRNRTKTGKGRKIWNTKHGFSPSKRLLLNLYSPHKTFELCVINILDNRQSKRYKASKIILVWYHMILIIYAISIKCIRSVYSIKSNRFRIFFRNVQQLIYCYIRNSENASSAGNERHKLTFCNVEHELWHLGWN